MNCDICHKEIKTKDKTLGTGYGILPFQGKSLKACYSCCAEDMKDTIRTEQKFYMYLVNGNGEKFQNGSVTRIPEYILTDWPGKLRIPVSFSKTGSHNWAGTRYDVWFKFEGMSFHGVQYGKNTQICHCKPIKDF